MIAELVELWSWFFGMVAGWGATTIGLVIALVILYLKHRRLSREVKQLYSRLVAFEREVSLRQKWDDK
jgi:biopolymer transport protein ExbB/TolQ